MAGLTFIRQILHEAGRVDRFPILWRGRLHLEAVADRDRAVNGVSILPVDQDFAGCGSHFLDSGWVVAAILNPLRVDALAHFERMARRSRSTFRARRSGRSLLRCR